MMESGSVPSSTWGRTTCSPWSTGWPAEIYVPASAIANIEHDVIHLSVAQGDVAQMGWQQAPRDDDVPAASPGTDLHRHI